MKNLIVSVFLSVCVISCAQNKELIRMGESARLTPDEIKIMKHNSDQGDWRAASKLYKHYAYAEQRPDLAKDYQWGIDKRNQ
jgi:hypothetical protein